MAVTDQELYQKFLGLMTGRKFGWGDELKNPGQIEDLLEKGTLLDREGKRIPGKAGRSEEDREKLIAKALKKGHAVYLYRKGEKYPREVRFDKEKNDFIVTDPIDQIELTEPKKPGWFKRYYLNLFSLMFRGKSLESVRDWKHYEHEKKAFENAKDARRVLRREKNDPILKAGGHAAPLEPENGLHSGESEAYQTLKEQFEQLQQQMKELQEQLREQKELNASLQKAVEPVPVVKAPKDGEQPEPMNLDGKEAVGHMEKEKAFFESTTAPTEQKPSVKAMDVTVEYTGAKQKELQKEKQEDQKTGAEKAEEKKEAEKPAFVPDDNPDKNPCDDLLERLKKQNTVPVTEQVEKNIRILYQNSENAVKHLELMNETGERYRGAEAVKQIVAFHSVKRQIEQGGLSMHAAAILGTEQGAKFLTAGGGLSDDMKHASTSAHAPEYFQKNFLDDAGLDKMTDAFDKAMFGFVNNHVKDEKELQNALNVPTAEKTEAAIAPAVKAPELDGLTIPDQMPLGLG